MTFHSKKLITVKELAEYLDVTTAAIYKWVKEGSMPRPIRFGGPRSMLRWQPDQIETWLEERKNDT